jgi:ApaG protein
VFQPQQNQAAPPKPPQFVYREEGHGICVEVIPHYIAEKSSPESQYFFFAYQVFISNQSDRGVKLLNRHWVIRDGQKKERFINGEGVIGQRPYIAAGETFEYTSFCPLNTPTGNMRGKYEFMDDTKNNFWVKVPLFFLRTPETFTKNVTLS